MFFVFFVVIGVCIWIFIDGIVYLIGYWVEELFVFYCVFCDVGYIVSFVIFGGVMLVFDVGSFGDGDVVVIVVVDGFDVLFVLVDVDVVVYDVVYYFGGYGLM